MLSFTGREALNQPYRFDLELVSERANLDLESLLHKPAFLALSAAGTGIHLSRRAWSAATSWPLLQQPEVAHLRNVGPLLLNMRGSRFTAAFPGWLSSPLGEQGVFLGNMRLYIRWLASIWRPYATRLREIGAEEDRLHPSQFQGGAITGLLGLPKESQAHRQSRLQRTKTLQTEREALRAQLGWLEEKWFKEAARPLPKEVSAQFGHYIHDQLAQRTVKSMGG